MNQTRSEFYGLMAATWDLLRGDTSNWADRFLFRKLIDRYGEPALDVGCSTGRLALDYLADGVDIDGVDLSPEMIEISREKARQRGLIPNLYVQAMESLDLPRRYRTILVPSSSFQLLTEPETARQGMKRLVEHLLPGGALVMPFMSLWKEGDPLEQKEWQLTGEQVRPEDGATVRRWSRTRFEPETRWEHSEDRYEVLRDGEVVQTELQHRSPAVRSYTQAQARETLEEAGLTDVRLLSGFSEEPVKEGDTLYTAVGVKP